jgi:hypothetical protein
MGLPTPEREFLRKSFAAAFSFKVKGDPTVAIMDFMQFVKVIPEGILTKDNMLSYFVGKVRNIMLAPGSTIRVMIVIVDGKPHPVKRMVEHEGRYKNANVYSSKQAPLLPKRAIDLIPTEWIRFAGNYKLLQRELYPELFNAFVECRYFTPKSGQAIVLSGFPGRSQWETVYGDNPWSMKSTNEAGKVLTVQTWKPEELPITAEYERMDPHLYHRVYMIENIAPCKDFPNGAIQRTEWEDARNDISEADLRMFYFEHWYQNESILFLLNDGDIFSIGTLYAFERLKAIQPDGTYVFRNKHMVCMPYKKTKDNEFFTEDNIPKHEYIDLNKLYELINEYDPMKAASVQNPVATMVFLLIMAGSDFFKDFLMGMGSQTVIWKVFFANIAHFTHMVQLSHGLVGHTRTKRVLIVDEDAFIQFIYLCYLEKYEKAELKKRKVSKLTFKQLKERTQTDAKGAPKEDARFHLPNRNTIRLWCRQVEWNLLYWKNGSFGILPDPFEMWYGLPYYPYWRDPSKKNKPVMVTMVASQPKPVDTVYDQNLYRTRILGKKRPRETPEEVAYRQQQVIDKYEHQIKS